MPKHFIYADKPSESQLCQGDVLSRTEGLMGILREYHRYFVERQNYKYFLVLTQTCDLVRRNGKGPSSPYVTLAAVRSLEEAIRREARKYQQWWQEPTKVLGAKTREKVDNFTSSLLDNNVPNYFYLHEDVSLGIQGRNCAFLALSVPIKSEHYDICLEAKIAQLKEPFSLKLGWLVGNMYSRVGTVEWDQHYGRGQVGKETRRVLKDIFVTVPQEKIEQGLSELQTDKQLQAYSPDEIFNYIKSKKIVPRSTRFKTRARDVLAAKYAEEKPRNVDQVVEVLAQDPVIMKILR